MVQRDLFICESSVPIMSATSTQLLCGLRDGTLVMFNATISSGMTPRRQFTTPREMREVLSPYQGTSS